MTPDDPRHGTNAGYMKHAETDRKYCDPCRAAHAEYHRNLWRRRYVLGVESLYIDSTGTQRRIQALQCLGWRYADIDQAAGVKTGWSKNALHGPRVNINQATGIKVAYDELSMRLGPSDRCRTWAQRKGWFPPLAWDDEVIDDPAGRPHGLRPDRKHTDVDPVAVERFLCGDWSVPLTKADRILLVAEWTAQGRSMRELERAGISKPERYVAREDGAA